MSLESHDARTGRPDRHRLGSFDAARRYFQRARATKDATPRIAERASLYLTEIERRDERSGLTGSVTAGIRYQTNATDGPESAVVRAAGLPA